MVWYADIIFSGFVVTVLEMTCELLLSASGNSSQVISSTSDQ
jgi:hypothetical protein